MSDDPVPVKCPRCRYEVTWIPDKMRFAPALDMYGKCEELTGLLDQFPERREGYGNNPRLCRAMNEEWVKVMRAWKKTQLPPWA